MNKKIYLILLVVAILSYSCSPNKSNNSLTECYKKIHTIHVPNPGSDSLVFLSRFIDEVKVVPLEFNEKCMLGNIKKIISLDSSIFVHDSQNNEGIFHFNISGKFVCRIGKLGKGPSEHATLTDFSINPETKSIYIYSNSQKKVLEYSFDNQIKKELLINFAADNFEYSNDLFYLYRKNPHIDEKYNLIIKDMEGHTIAGYFKSNPKNVSSLSKVFLNLQDSLFFYQKLIDTIYSISGLELKQNIIIEYEKHKVKHQDLIAMQDWSTNIWQTLNKNDYIAGIENLFVSGGQIVFTYVYKNIQNISFFDIHEKKLVTSYSVMDDLSWFTFFYPISQANQWIISVYDPAFINKNLENINFHAGKLIPIAQATAANNRIKVLQNNSEPHKINPFLIFYKLK